MFRFAEPAWLWGLALVPALSVLHAWAGIRRRRALVELADAALVGRLADSVSATARRWKAALGVAAMGLLALALARPQFGTRVETVRSVGQDIVVAVDLSRSMLAEDVPPNRLERARLAILRLMQRLDGDRIGLVAFAADAFVQSPLTVDYSAAGMFLAAMHPDLMPVQGTDLGSALRVSLDALEQGAREARTVVIVTDGEDHEGTFEPQLERAAAEGVRVHVVGIGSMQGVPIPLYDEQGDRVGFLRDEDGSVVTTRLGDETLRRVAERTGARYVRVDAGGAALDELLDELAGAEGEALEERQITQFEEQFQIFLGMAGLLLLVEWLLPEGRGGRQARGREDRASQASGGSERRAVPRAAALALFAALAVPLDASAQAGRAQVREGNRLYEQGRYQEAHEKYLEALAEAPESGLVRYNDGNALYKSGDFGRAVEAYRRALESGDEGLAAAAWYNLGNALFRQEQLEASLEAYKQALRLRPDDADAKHNLERVLELMQARQQGEQTEQAGGSSDRERNGSAESPPGGAQAGQEQGDAIREPEGGGSEGGAPEGGAPEAEEPRGLGQAGPERGPGQMTREEAERLLGAVREDPSEVERRRAPRAARAPRRPW
jgi:Ca-activated chloride channel family protein